MEITKVGTLYTPGNYPHSKTNPDSIKENYEAFSPGLFVKFSVAWEYGFATIVEIDSVTLIGNIEVYIAILHKIKLIASQNKYGEE